MATLVEPAIDEMSIRPFSIAEYHWLIEHDFFHEDERVELVTGILVQMSPKGVRHAACRSKMLHLLLSQVRDDALVRAQGPITLCDSNSEPEADIVLAAPRAGEYVDRHPYPADVLLVVEVADSSLEYDRCVKVPLYAAAGICEYWLMNLQEDYIEVHRGPTSPPTGTAYYRKRVICSAQETIRPAHFPNCAVPVADALLLKRDKHRRTGA